ncbi:unnamed protein product, partial [Prorocentrum cordatum]
MDQNYERLKGQGLELDDSWKILFLEESIGLDESGMQMLRVMSRGSKDYEEVIGAVREMGVTLNEATAATCAACEDDDDLCECSDVSSMTSEQEAWLLESIAEADVDEHELPEVLATLKKERKNTWKDNRDARDSFESTERVATGGGFALLNGSGPTCAIVAAKERNSFCARDFARGVADRARSAKVEVMSLLVTDPGGIAVGAAAGQALIGPRALKRLEQRLGELGLRVAGAKGIHECARGVGGKTPARPGLLIPTGIEGKAGIMKLDLIERDAPAVVPIGMQEQMKAVIDLPNAEMTPRQLGATARLKRLSSGHRTIAIGKLGRPEDFELP